VIEATARLHNFCIDCKTSLNLEDYIIHDDLFWTRTSCNPKRRAFLVPNEIQEELVPNFADARTIAAHTGVDVDASTERSTRQRVCQHIIDQGFRAPNAGSIMKRITRTCGINDSQQVPFVTRAIGAVLH
jgi:hypothetical protein